MTLEFMAIALAFEQGDRPRQAMRAALNPG
jgi:hypothetical protein